MLICINLIDIYLKPFSTKNKNKLITKTSRVLNRFLFQVFEFHVMFPGHWINAFILLTIKYRSFLSQIEDNLQTYYHRKYIQQIYSTDKIAIKFRKKKINQLIQQLISIEK